MGRNHGKNQIGVRSTRRTTIIKNDANNGREERRRKRREKPREAMDLGGRS
jgi:hypothetical protein